MSVILSGLIARGELKKSLVAKIKTLQKKQGAALTLAIVQVGDRADSTAYINSKRRFAAEIGVSIKLISLQENVEREEIIAEIKKLNQDKEISGIIVQLPLPKNLDEQAILDVIDPSKDADAITSTNIKVWTVQGPTLYPATARGVGELLDFYNIALRGKKVCVIGRSHFVGNPIACLCRAKGAIVTVCHSKTIDLVKETMAADVVISVVGKAGLITAGHVRAGQAIIDVGISEIVGVNSGDKLDKKLVKAEQEWQEGQVGQTTTAIPKRKLVGDVDFEKVTAVLGDKGAITPVPGGVGPMTVLALFENLVDCAKI